MTYTGPPIPLFFLQPTPPTDANPASNSVVEGAAVNTQAGITAFSTDFLGLPITYALASDNSGGGFKIDPNTGVVTVADTSKINFETAPGHAYTITVQASDLFGLLTNTQTFTIGVTDVAPSTPVDANAAANSVAEGAASGTTVGITASSTDVNGPGVTYSLTADSSGGGFTVNATTGVITVANSAKIDYETSPGHAYTVTVQASDGTLTSSQTFTIGVTDVPLPVPVDSNAASNSVAEGAVAGSTVGLTASANDPNGPPTTYSLIGDTSAGGFTINATTGVVTVANPGKIDFETAPGHAYSVTVKADDGLASTTQSFVIGVTDVAPSTPVDSDAAGNSLAEGAVAGTTVGVTASSTDVNGPAVTYSLTGDTSGGGFTVNATTGVITVADPAKIDYETSPGHNYTVTAQASDGTLTSSQTFTIGVTDVAPSIPVDSNAAGNSVAEGAAAGTTVGVTASSTDVNGGAVTWSLTGDTSGGGFTINATTGVITVADPTKIDYETSPGHSYTVTAQASDGTLTSSQTFVIGVTDVAPSTPVDSNAAGNTVAEGAANGSTVGLTASSADVNGGAVTYALTGDSSGGGFTVNATTGVITVANSTKIDYETAAGHAYSITVQASDGTLTSSQSFSIGVTDVAPSTPVDSDAATNQISQNAPAGSYTGVTASSTDVNGPAVTYSLTGDSSGGGFTIDPATGKVTVADPSKVIYNAGSPSYTVTADASDGTLHSQQTFTINVILDTPPVANDDSVSATEAGGLNNAVAGSNPSGNVILGTGAAGSVQDTDAEDPSSALVAVAVHTGPKGAPVTAGTIGSPLAGDHGALTLNSNGTYSYQVNQTDAQVQALHTSAETITDVFDYTIQDTGGLQSTATLTITIHGADDLPQAVADTGSMTEDDAPTSFNVIANDTQDPDHTASNAITIGPGGVTVTGPAGETFVNSDVTASIVSNQIQLSLTNSHFQQLAAGEHATVTVPYTLTGDPGETSIANLVVTVNGVNDVPVAVDDTPAAITEDQVGTFSVLANDTLDADHGAPNNVTTGTVTNLVAPSGENIDVTDIGVSVNGSNQVVVTLGADFQHMQDGQTATFDIPYTLHGDQPGDTSTATLHVTVDGANDAPTASNFTFNGVNSATANTDLVVDGPGAGTPDPAGPQKTVSGDLLGGAADIDGPGPLVVVAGTITTAHNGTVTMLANGDFTYKPALGYTGADSFTYTVSDQNPGVAGTATGTVNLNVIAPKVWYVNADAGTDGDGSSEHPFNTLAHFANSGVGNNVDSAGDTIFLETSAAHYTGGLTLENNEQLISQSNGLVVPDGGGGAGTVTLVAASGLNAVIDGGLVLGSGDNIQGVDFGTTSGFAVSGSSVGTLHLDDATSGVINNGSGGGISIGGSSNVLNVDFSSVTTTAGTNGIALTNASGTFHVHGGAISGASGADVALNGTNVNFTDDGTISDAAGTVVSITNMTGGTQSFTGAITGGSVSLSNNTGATIDFSGGLNLSTGASNAFSATGGGTLNVTGTNHLTTTTGTALNIANTTIGASNVTFHDISANGALNGIVLNNTGSSGHLVVTGSGSTALGGDSSGGTIQNTTGQAISLTNTNGPSFTNLNIHDSALSGINGTRVTNFTLANSAINNVNTAHNTTDGDVTFNLSAGGSTENNLSGAVSITGNTLNNSWQDGISINNYAGTISNLTITGNSLTSVSTFQAGSAGTAIKVLAQQENGSTAAQITAGTISDNIINNFPGGGGIVVHGGSTTALAAVNIGSSGNHFKIDGNTITGAGTGLAGIGTNGIEVTIGHLSNGYFNIGELGHGNTITNVAGDGIAGSLFGSGTASYDIGYNTIDANNTAGSPGINTGADSAVSNADTPTLYLNIHNNNVQHTQGAGILSTIRSADGTGYFKIENNSVTNLTAPGLQFGIRVDAGNGTEATGAHVILQIDGNTAVGSSNGSHTITDPGIGLRQNHSGVTSSFQIVGLTPTPANDSQMETYVSGQNPGSASGTFGTGGTASISSGATYTAATLPAFPLLAAAGGVQASSPTLGEMNLTQSELDSVVAAAIAQWAAAGASASQLAALHATTFSVADLSGTTIGEESSPAHITIDINAAGHGWFVDPTPSDNFEFAHAVNAAGTDLFTDPSNAAAGHLDLLTTVTHELGHVLGLADNTAPADVNDLMYINLLDGERRLPDAADVAQTKVNAPQAGVAPLQATDAALSAPAHPAGNAPIVVGTSGNDAVDAGPGGKILFGGGPDNFAFGHDIQPNASARAPAQPMTHLADDSAAQGDTFDFSALTPTAHATNIADNSPMQGTIEGHSGTLMPQFTTATSAPPYPNALPDMSGAANWADVARIDGAHSGDAVNVPVDVQSALHLAQLHTDLLV